MRLGQIKDYVREGSQVRITYEQANVVITVLTPEIINVFEPLYTEEHYSKAIEGEKAIPTEFTCVAAEVNGERVLFVTTAALRLTIGAELAIELQRADGTVLLRTHRAGRVFQETLSADAQKILESEGHSAASRNAVDFPVQMVFDLEENDCFYGLGDKSGFLNKKYYEYENWNSDLPQAHNEDFHALYKSIPFVIGKKSEGVYGLFFDNTFRSFLNFGKEQLDYFYYGAVAGNLDVYLIGGAHMTDIVKNYTYLTGRTPLPQRWTLGYQQSRWGYASAEDMRYIARNMRECDIPCDAIHFDIDYMDHYKVFTWNEEQYGKAGDIIEELGRDGFKVVTIIDPGTKLEDGYFMREEGRKKGFFATDAEGEIYVNEVWPGESNYPDFGRKEVRDWWGDHHQFLVDIGVAGVWNDMNEPASFKGELPQDVVFHDEERRITHAEMHNVYGHYMSKATYEGLRRLQEKRPFVITRACYAGTQKYSTVWTGDNQSLWAHVQMMIPQLCNLGLSGFSFAGTDIGGFGADTTPELLTRWIEAACFSPLFRNHSAQGTKRQEPWMFDEQTLSIYRRYVKLRYRFLPYLYDLFYEGEQTGLPIMRPLVLHYEDDVNVWNLNDEFLVGENLLVAPVVEQGATKRMVYLPEGEWVDFWTGEHYSGQNYLLADAPIDVCPMYLKAGTMIPTYEVQSYVGEKAYDKLILLTTKGAASYRHFQDNGVDDQYQKGAYNLYQFDRNAAGVLHTEYLHEGYEKYSEIIVEEIG